MKKGERAVARKEGEREGRGGIGNEERMVEERGREEVE